MIRRRLLSTLVLLAAAAPAAAHPGHGSPELASSWLHYLLEPEHGLTLAALAFSVAVLLRRSLGSGQRHTAR
jgi:hypothetical protein